MDDRITFWRLVVIVAGLGLLFFNSLLGWDLPILLPVTISMIAILAYLIKSNK